MRAFRLLESVDVLDILSSRSSGSSAGRSVWASAGVAGGIGGWASSAVVEGCPGGSAMAGVVGALPVGLVSGPLGTGVGDWGCSRVGSWGPSSAAHSGAPSSRTGFPSRGWCCRCAAFPAFPTGIVPLPLSGSVWVVAGLGPSSMGCAGGCFRASSSAMSISSSSVSESSTSSTVVGLAKLWTIGVLGPFFRPLSHRNASSCHSSLTLIHFHSQSRVINPDCPVGCGGTTLAGSCHDWGWAVYLAACLGVRHLAQIANAVSEPPSARKQAAPILFHGCQPLSSYSVPLKSCRWSCRSVSGPPGRKVDSSWWWLRRFSHSHLLHVSQNGGIGWAAIVLLTL